MQIRDMPKPAPKPGWVVLDVRDAGICGSEISAFLGKNELRKPPMVMGHEFSGFVREIGDSVSPDLMGKLVAVNPLVSCMHCRYCKNGERHLCLERKFIGVDFPGGFAEYAAVPVLSCFPVMNPSKGALVEPFACAIRAVEHSRVRVGDTALVFGAGTIGLMATKLLRAGGASECVVVDTVPSRLDWARMWGATGTIDASRMTGVTGVKSSAPEGFDCIVDAVGHDKTRSQSIEIVRRGGRVVFIGLHENLMSLPGNAIVRNEVEIVGSFCYSDDNFRRAISLAEHGFLETSGGWLDTRPLRLGQEAFVEQATGPAPFSKILLEP